ncbi:hypothetical protein KNV09_gp151 [Vibrio phage Athena]|uniref:Uncharacterized protein n=11 Tax=Thalassavirus TaxID=2948922 RepID=A0A6M4EU03_9CAUD|nr:hypothetical protein FDJ20_gp157 [Vibrio phage Thalassa]YP_010101917.1 hypothetical protein KNU52_gp135 [Vibrio phage Achelous]YP_010102572.1 hypothetical protein KNU58_gp133 [Vibrio phage Brizo]YP_010102754.1 hypothetical protein KNU59_gp146 [Vibrio phage Pontus]YP_010105733.1 hypothetical protein KNU87_gp146 [Vibrio phage Bennett]YP_010105924.1 hypothetical protein KNU88_gp148 [Vibrio phage Chester]YP_010107986.1 hypothetical protein KNV05_gp155 [Vibrio phage River4]YP_010108182.1 hypot
MSWIGITALVSLFVVFAALISAYSRGYAVGYKDGEESGQVLSSLESLKPVEEKK